MGRIIIEYKPKNISLLALMTIKTELTPHMFSADGSSSQYCIDQCKDLCIKKDLKSDVEIIDSLIDDDGVSYLEF